MKKKKNNWDFPIKKKDGRRVKVAVVSSPGMHRLTTRDLIVELLARIEAIERVLVPRGTYRK